MCIPLGQIFLFRSGGGYRERDDGYVKPNRSSHKTKKRTKPKGQIQTKTKNEKQYY